MEYFIADKISLGTEYGWSISRSSQGAGSVTAENWTVDGDGNGSRETESTESGDSSSFFGTFMTMVWTSLLVTVQAQLLSTFTSDQVALLRFIRTESSIRVKYSCIRYLLR